MVERWQGDFDGALERMERAYAVLVGDEPDEDIGLLTARLGSAHVFRNDIERAAELLDRASAVGEAVGSAAVIADAFVGRAMVALGAGRPQESIALLRQALAIALEHDLEQVGSIYFNLSDRHFHADRYREALDYLEDALASARRRGSRPHEWAVLAEMTYPLTMLGRWDEALELAAEIPEDRLQESVTLSLLSGPLEIHLQRGRVEEARRLLSLYPERSPDVQEQSSYDAARIAVLEGEGRSEEALAAAVVALDPAHGPETSLLGYQQGKQILVHAVEAALALGRREQAEELLALVDELPPGLRPPYLTAHARRLRGRLAADPVETAAAAAAFRSLDMPFWAAVCELEQAELLGPGGESEPLLETAGEAFSRLGAAPWLERAAAGAGRRADVPA
jgi:tetratricopeptide (TPR) repeat protein